MNKSFLKNMIAKAKAGKGEDREKKGKKGETKSEAAVMKGAKGLAKKGKGKFAKYVKKSKSA